MTIGNTGGTPPTGPLKPTVGGSVKVAAGVSVEAKAPADGPKPTRTDDVSTARPAWDQVRPPEPQGDDDWPAYDKLFGKAPYVKDPADAKLREIVGAAAEVSPELAKGPVGKALAAGKLDAGAIKALQERLKAQGYDLGPAGADGKLGPKTYAALVKFLDNDGGAAAPKGGALKVDGHGTGVEVPKKKPLTVDGHGTGVEIPEPKAPLKVDGHGTGLEIKLDAEVRYEV